MKEIIGNKYILIDKKILYLYGFENLQTYTVEAGELYKGACINGFYQFKIINLLAYNNIFNLEKILYKLKLSSPSITAICNLTLNVKENERFNSSCKINNKNFCSNLNDNLDLIVGSSNPSYTIYDSKRIVFKKFIGKSTIISISAGNLKKKFFNEDNKIYTIVFENSNFNYSLFNSNLSFYLNIEINNSEEKNIACLFEKDIENINCIIENMDSENVNIKILNNPENDTKSIPNKTIEFNGFLNRTIYTLVAGRITTGKCERNFYTFYFNDSINEIMLDEPFYLQIKDLEKNATCNTIEREETSTFDIKCIIEGKNSCLVEDDEIIIENVEPEPIIIDDLSILYFSNFVGKNSIKYKLSVGPILKYSKIEGNKFYFSFLYNTFIHDLINNEVSFSFPMFFNDKQVESNCTLNQLENDKNITILCYFELVEENHEQISYYDLRIGNDTNRQRKIFNNEKEIISEGFNNQKTFTIIAGNIYNKSKDTNIFYFTIEYNKIPDEIDNSEFMFNLTIMVDKLYDSQCSIKEHILECEANIELITSVEDIIILENPNYYIFNNNAIYFVKFKDLRTFTIKAGQIEKLECHSFNLKNTISSDNITENITFEILVKEYEEGENHKVICNIQTSNKYDMNC